MPKIPQKQKDVETIRKALARASQTWSDFMATMNVFQNNVHRRHFVEAEAEREQLHVLVDAYVDQFIIAGQLIESTNKGVLD